MSDLTHTTDAAFEADVLKADKPVLVDFWAEWCGPCKMIAPLLEETAHEQPDLKIVKVDVDANPRTAQKYGIRGIPTLMLFKNGLVSGQKTGAVSKSQLAQFLAPQVSRA